MVSDRTVYVRLKGDVSVFEREMAKARAQAKAFADELDTSTDRTAMFTQSLLAVGPALVPITAAAIPAISGLTNQLGFAVAGAGAAVLAFQGVGDALKATNEYAIDPTSANLEKMNQALSELGPAGQEFVGFLQQIRPELQGLQDAAQAGIFPGLEDGITDLMTRLPQVERIVGEVSGAIGDLMAEAGDNLADPRWDEFFSFIETEARTTLMDLGRTIGNLGEGFANLWMAFDPLSDNFSQSFLQMSRDFAEWTAGLDETEGFQEFLAYIERVGPKAFDALASLGNALLQIVEAAAPVGEVMLPAIEALADAIAVLADSDLAPLAIGIVSLTSAYSRLVAVSQTANSSALGGLFGKSTYAGAARAAKDVPLATRAYLDFGAALDSTGPKAGKFATTADRLGAALRGGGKIAAGAGGLAFVMSDLDDKLGLSNTAMGAMTGSLIGPWGTAIGAGAGLVMDLTSQTDGLTEALEAAKTGIENNVGSLEEQKAIIDELAEANKVVEDLGWGSHSDEIDELRDKYRDNVRAAEDLKFAEAGLGTSMDGASQAARKEMQAIIDLRNEHNRAADAALASRDAENAYEAAIDNAAESVKENGKTLDKHTEAGRANRAAVDDIITTFNTMDYATQQANGGLEGVRNAYAKASVAAGGAEDKARALATELAKLKSPPQIDIKTRDLSSDVIASIQAARDRLSDKTFTITTRRLELIQKGSLSDRGAEARAPGGFTGLRIPDGYATGERLPLGLASGGRPWEEGFSGRVPGTPPADPTVDNVFAMTAKGNPLMLRSREWIINEPQSDKNDRWLRAINNGLNLDDLFGPLAIPGFVSGGRYDDFKALTHSSKLDIARQEQRIIELDRSLKEKETVKRDGKKVKVDAVRGKAREVAKLELQEARAELAKMKSENAALKNYGTDDEESARNDAEQKAIDAAEKIVQDAAARFTSAKSDAASLVSIGSATSAAAVDRNLTRLLRDSNTFLGLLGDLKSKNTSPWLLGELVKAGPTPGAIRLAREYNTNQGALDSINARASQIDQYTNAYAGLVGNSQFMTPGAWNSGVSSTSVHKTFEINAVDPSAFVNEIDRRVRHILAVDAAGGGL